MKRILNGTLRCLGIRLMCAGVIACCSSISLPAQTNTAAPTPSGPRPAPRRTSVILIMADNLGYGELGCYGQTKIKTPNLDKLASEGVRFNNFYAASPDAGASRAALMTGLEPRHSRAGFNQLLATNAVTIANLLQDAGYHTGLIGEWSLGDTTSTRPDAKGFYEFIGFLNQSHARDYYTDRMYRIDPQTKWDKQVTFYDNQEGRRGLYIPDLLTSSAIAFVRKNAPDEFNQYRPFFLCLAYPLPQKGPVPNDAPYSGETWSQLDKDRAAMITRMDAGIGQLLAEVKRLRFNTNTLVVFTSVRGPVNEGGLDVARAGGLNATGPLRGVNGSLYEGGLRVPMILSWPFKVQSGRVNDIPWAGWDLLPTVADSVSLKAPGKIDGISILPSLRGRTQTNQHDVLYWEYRGDALQQAARMGDWKIVRTNSAAAPELYDLKSDPAEKQNVARKNPSALKKLEKVLSDSARTESK